MILLFLRFFSLRSVLKILTPPVRFHPYHKIQTDDILELIQKRLAHPRFMIRRACLRKGLLTYHFLRLAGFKALFHIGVYPPECGRRLQAHCRVSVGNKFIDDEPDSNLTDIFIYPGIQSGFRYKSSFVQMNKYFPKQQFNEHSMNN
jgi:hypothetical protein